MVDLETLKRVADNVRAAYYGSDCLEAQYIDLAVDEIVDLRTQFAVIEKALELAVEEGKPEDCGYCPITETCQYDGNNCLQQLREHFIRQASIEISGEDQLIIDDLLVHELHYHNGQIDMKIGGESAMLFMTAIIEFFKQNGGQNFLTFTVAGQGEEYSITIQNLKGEISPAVKMGQLEKVAEAAKLSLTNTGTQARAEAISVLRQALLIAGYGE